MKDPIVEEVHEARAQIAAENGYDLARLFALFQARTEQARARGESVVSLPPKPAPTTPPRPDTSAA